MAVIHKGTSEAIYRREPPVDKKVYRKRIPQVGMRFVVKKEDSEFLEKDCWAEVEETNNRNLFYVVRYMGIGIRECFSTVKGEAYRRPNDQRIKTIRKNAEKIQ